MKMLIFSFVGVLAIGISGPAQAQNPPLGVSPGASSSPTATGAVKKHGRMMMMKEGQMAALTQDMPLANGTTLRPNGTLLMPNGQQMPLSEGEQVTMSGMVMPAPHPVERRMTRFNKHVAAGMMPPVR